MPVKTGKREGKKKKTGRIRPGSRARPGEKKPSTQKTTLKAS